MIEENPDFDEGDDLNDIYCQGIVTENLKPNKEPGSEKLKLQAIVSHKI